MGVGVNGLARESENRLEDGLLSDFGHSNWNR